MKTMTVEIEWEPFNRECPTCCGGIEWLVCDIHGNIYMAEYDDDRQKFYPVYGHRDFDFEDIPDVTHFAYLPETPNKKRRKMEGRILNDDAVPSLLKAMHGL